MFLLNHIYFRSILFLFLQEVDPKVENDDMTNDESIDSFLSELTNAIPGVDEAMSFAEMLKYVFLEMHYLI